MRTSFSCPRLATATLLATIASLLIASSPVLAADTPDLFRTSYQAEARGDYKGALSRVNEARKAGADAYFTQLRSGWLLYLSGDYAAAEKSYREALSTKPKSQEAKVALTLVLFAAKQWADLEKACAQALAANPQNPTLRARQAAAQYHRGNYPDAASAYRKLVEEYPGELDFHTGYAWALVRLGKREEARKVFEQVLALSPDNPNALEGMSFR